MAMTDEKYEAMVSRLEEVARRDPAKYRLRVALLAAAGYGYILLIVGVLFALVAAIVIMSWRAGRVHAGVIKFGWIVLALAWFVLEALWIRMSPPEGIELRREDAPELFSTVDEATTAIGAPRIQHVLVDADYNAGVAQVPRLGPLGWFRNYLVLGLPLMQALSPEHFRAVLAHELGHLSGNHGRFSGWVYRVRASWLQLFHRFQRDERWGAFLFTWFFNWYAPYFHAYSFVLARAHEYEADASAGRLAGARLMGDALIAYRTKGAHLDEGYWPEVFKEADTQPRPVAGAFARLSSVLREPLPSESAADHLRRALQEQTAHDDTHPALSARLAALGHPAAAGDAGAQQWIEGLTAAPLAETAASRFLGAHESRLAEQLDEVWQRSVSDDWRARHRYVSESQRKLAALREKAGASELTPDEKFHLGQLTAEFGEPDEAVPLLAAVPPANPNYAEANFLLGNILLARDDEAGVRHLEEAMGRDPEAVLPGCQILLFYFAGKGREEEAARYRERAEKQLAAFAAESN